MSSRDSVMILVGTGHRTLQLLYGATKLSERVWSKMDTNDSPKLMILKGLIEYGK